MDIFALVDILRVTVTFGVPGRDTLMDIFGVPVMFEVPVAVTLKVSDVVIFDEV